MTPHLNWQLDGNNWFAPIFLGYCLNIYYNGEGYYNVELFDSHGNEEGCICGGETIELARLSALGWLTDELKKVTND